MSQPIATILVGDISIFLLAKTTGRIVKCFQRGECEMLVIINYI